MENKEKLVLAESIWECVEEALELDSDDSAKDEQLLGKYIIVYFFKKYYKKFYFN